jgi:hypothetical protein
MPLAQSIVMNDVNVNPLRNLPSVERVLRAGPGALAVPRFGQKWPELGARRCSARTRSAVGADFDVSIVGCLSSKSDRIGRLSDGVLILAAPFFAFARSPGRC